jgi:hypothetical protein
MTSETQGNWRFGSKLAESSYQVLGDDRPDYADGPTWRDCGPARGHRGAQKRARLVLEGDELRVMLGRLQGIALEKLAIQLGIPPSTVHDIEKRAARRMLEKMEPMMAMIDFGFHAALIHVMRGASTHSIPEAPLPDLSNMSDAEFNQYKRQFGFV